MEFIKKHYGNIFFALLVVILIFNPFGLGMTIKSSLIKLISGSPKVSQNGIKLSSYNYKLESRTGETVDFNEYKGKVVLVNYWATWCPPCVAEMPSIQKLYNDYGNKMEFVLIASDTKDKVEPFLKKNNYSLPIFYEKSRILQEFQTNSIPTTYLINKNGEIVVSEKGAKNWNSDATRKIIDNLLND